MNAHGLLKAGDRVLVTGASGFLGSHLVPFLRDHGLDVVSVGRAKGFHLLSDELPLEGVRHVFHLAGETGVVEAWKDPTQFHLVNAHGTVRVLDQCRNHGCSVTYVGAYIYGVPHALPINEDHAVQPNNPYAFSKWMGEEACRWYAGQYDMAVTAIRLFNVYGPGQSDRFLISRIVGQLLDPKVMTIELMDLSPRRDYLHVNDAVRALTMSVPGNGFHVFNVGHGSSYSVAEVVEIAMDSFGIRKPVVDRGEARPNEIPDVIADCSRIRSFCGWEPQVDMLSGVATLRMGVES